MILALISSPLLLFIRAVHLGHMLGQLLVLVAVHGVQQQEDEVETGEQSSWEVDILLRKSYQKAYILY